MSNLEKFKVVIAGGRDFSDARHYITLKKTLDFMLQKKREAYEIIIISGCARGADSLGEEYARERGYDCMEFPANWTKYGRGAGHRRNAEMCTACDAVIAFWDGKSKGTAGMIALAKKNDKLLKVVRY